MRFRSDVSTLRGLVFCISCCLTVLGCSSSPVKASAAKSVPPDRVLNKIEPSGAKPARVTLIADKGLGGPSMLFKVDGKELATIYSGEKIDFQIDSGSHIFAIKTWDGTLVEVETLLKENERAYYRVLIPGYGVTIQKSAEVAD